MAKIVQGRMTHDYEGELVVFHIGMTLNRWWRPDKWLPVFFQMPPMLRELASDPESGLLGFEILLGGKGPYIVQYWSSAEKLYAYAAASSRAHRPAWAKFNAMARKSPGAVGIWHETYLVDRAETFYGGTPPFGLGKATALRAVGKRHSTARARFADGATRAAAG
ncbi:MAG: DUF4188 domain-containing protein [Pseudoclavibacter sp.]